MAYITSETQQIESAGKLRVEKKWKNRYFVAKHPPDVDNIIIKVFKNERESRKESKCRQTIVLRTFYGSESGFVLGNEPNTLAILCESIVLVMAFQSLDVLRDWELWMRRAYRFGAQFQMRIVSVPPESDLSRLDDPHVRLHLHDGSFCIAVGCPPRVIGAWKIAHLRRFGPLHNRFVFEAGTRAGRGLSGLFSFLCTQNEYMHTMFQLAARNQLHDHLANKRSIQYAQASLRRAETVSRESSDVGTSHSRMGATDSLLRQLQDTPRNNSRSQMNDAILMMTAPPAASADRRPLLASVGSSNGDGSGINIAVDAVDPEVYTNEVFDEGREEMGSDSARSPQPFIFPDHIAPNTPNPIGRALKMCKCGGSVQQPVTTPSFAAILPTFGVIACPVHPGQGGPVWIPSSVSDAPTKASSATLPPTSTPATPRLSAVNASRERLPKEAATLPRTQRSAGAADGTCRVCSDHRNYVNQNFIDSLQQYYNFDAVFYPAAIAVPLQYVQMAPQSAPPFTSGRSAEQSHDGGYIPWDPDSRSSGQRSPPPPDPTSRSAAPRTLTVQTDNIQAQQPSTPSPPHLSAMAASVVPPFMPFTLPRRRSTTASSYSSTSKSPTRRALSTCLPLDPRLILPDEKGCARTWSLGGTVGRRRSRSVFARSSPPADAIADSVSLRRGGLLRDSSRRARRLLAVFKKMKKDASALHDPPHLTPPQVSTTATVAATLSTLDLDDPIFASGASARAQSGSARGASGGTSAGKSLLSATRSFPARDLSTIVDLSSESGHALSRPASHARMNDATSSPPNIVAPALPSVSNHPARRSSSGGLDPLVFRGLVKLSPPGDPTRPPITSRLVARRLSDRAQQRLQETLTSSVSGSYSVYDGEASPRKELTNSRTPDTVERPLPHMSTENDGDTIAAAMQRMQKMRLLSDRQATFRLGGVFGEGISATSSPKLQRSKPSESTMFRFPSNPSSSSTSNAVVSPESIVNYCDLSVGDKKMPIPPTPRTAVQPVDTVKTNYARIDALSTIAAKEASDQRKLDRRMQSSSTQTLSRKTSTPSFFSKRFIPSKRQSSFLRRRTSITSLTDL